MAPSPGISRKTAVTFVFGLSLGFIMTYIGIVTKPYSGEQVNQRINTQHFIPKDPHSHGETDDFVGPEQVQTWQDHDHESHQGKLSFQFIFFYKIKLRLINLRLQCIVYNHMDLIFQQFRHKNSSCYATFINM